MTSKTPRTVIGEYMNASYTRTAKPSHIQSRVRESPNTQDMPRSPSWMGTSSRKTSSSVPKLKSPGRPIVHDRVSRLRAKGRQTLSVSHEEITPRTMVAAFLEGADSTMPLVRQRARTSQTGVTSSVPALINKGGQSLPKSGSISRISSTSSDTPRTLIQQYLQSASDPIETPLVRSQRGQSQSLSSPEVDIPSQRSYSTPSPFKSSASERSSGNTTTRSATRKTPRRTPRHHVPIYVEAPRSMTRSESHSPNVSTTIQGTFQTPSPFKMSMSEESITDNLEYTRQTHRRTQRGAYSLSIPEHMLDREKSLPNLPDHEEEMDEDQDSETQQTYRNSPGVENIVNEEEQEDENTGDDSNENSVSDVKQPYRNLHRGENIVEAADDETEQENLDDVNNDYIIDETKFSHGQRDESMDSTKAQYSFDQSRQGAKIVDDNDGDIENVEDDADFVDEYVDNDDKVNSVSVRYSTREQLEDDVDDDGDGGDDNAGDDHVDDNQESNVNQTGEMQDDYESHVNVKRYNQSANIIPDSFVPEFTSTQQHAERQEEIGDNDQMGDDGYEDVDDEIDNEDNRMDVEDAPEPVIQEKKKPVRKPRQKSKYSLPVTVVKKQFTHFAGMRVAKDAIEEVMKASEKYWDNLALDLEAYAKHAGRKTITMADFHLLFKRQGLVHDKQSLYSLIEKYLPMEERRKLIPVARAGNRIELW